MCKKPFENIAVKGENACLTIILSFFPHNVFYPIKYIKFNVLRYIHYVVSKFFQLRPG